MKTERQTDIKSEIVRERERECVCVCVCVWEREREMALPESGILVRLKFTQLSQVQNTTNGIKGAEFNCGGLGARWAPRSFIPELRRCGETQRHRLCSIQLHIWEQFYHPCSAGCEVYGSKANARAGDCSTCPSATGQPWLQQEHDTNRDVHNQQRGAMQSFHNWKTLANNTWILQLFFQLWALTCLWSRL